MLTMNRAQNGRSGGVLHAPATIEVAGVMRRTERDKRIGRSVTASLMGDPPPNRSMLKGRNEPQLEAACELAGISLSLLRRSSFMTHGAARKQIVVTLREWGWTVADIACELDYDAKTVCTIIYRAERGAE